MYWGAAVESGFKMSSNAWGYWLNGRLTVGGIRQIRLPIALLGPRFFQTCVLVLDIR